MAAARQQTLPPEVVTATTHRILDTVAAMVSGARLKPGEAAIRFARAQGGVPEASILTTDVRTSAINAALVNGMFAHADETDDFEPVAKAHPGCAVVPAALSIGERSGCSGEELLRAVALGYDFCCRWLLALGPNHVRATHRSAEGVSSTIGAAAAAASMTRLDEKGMRFALSYAVQQVSGVWSWERDLEHVEKAFDFAGMGARNGVTAAVMAQMEFTGVETVLEGEHNALDAHSTQPRPEEMAEIWHALLRDGNRHQDVLGWVSHPVGARRLPVAATRAQHLCRFSRADHRHVARNSTGIVNSRFDA